MKLEVEQSPQIRLLRWKVTVVAQQTMEFVAMDLTLTIWNLGHNLITAVATTIIITPYIAILHRPTTIFIAILRLTDTNSTFITIRLGKVDSIIITGHAHRLSINHRDTILQIPCTIAEPVTRYQMDQRRQAQDQTLSVMEAIEWIMGEWRTVKHFILHQDRMLITIFLITTVLHLITSTPKITSIEPFFIMDDLRIRLHMDDHPMLPDLKSSVATKRRALTVLNKTHLHRPLLVLL